MEQALTPFQVSVSDAEIDDLKLRLQLSRLPERETVEDWSQGVPLAKVQALIGHWRDRYDWRRFERQINSHPQFRTEIDGLGIHFIHVRSKHSGGLPIVLTHGWPGSVVEFLKVIGSIDGSDKPWRKGRGCLRLGDSIPARVRVV